MDQEFENIENLERGEAIEKIKELVKHNSMCLFSTNLADVPAQTRPMNVLQVDDNGWLWFLSAYDSDKNHHIDTDARVQLYFANPGSSEYMTIYGAASVLRDREKIEELWKPLVKAWFTEGKDDARITAIQVIPWEAFYWDTKHNKMVALIKVVAAAMTGKTMDDSVEGRLDIH